MSQNLKIQCQCGQISFLTSRSKPLDLYFCHCSECRRQSSSAFGTSAIFPTSEIQPFLKDHQHQLGMWTRSSKTGGTMECYFCNSCGTRIAHMTVMPDGTTKPQLSVKGGCLEGLDATNAKHIYTRNAVVPVPEDGIPGSPSEQ